MINKHKLFNIRNRVSLKYHTPQSTMKRPVNAIFFNPSNTIEHELRKAELCYDLLKQKKKFITEAVNIETNERHDVVCLDDNRIYEICNKNDSVDVLKRYMDRGYTVIHVGD